MKNSILNYEVVSKDNIDLAIKVQNTIFPEENGAQNFIDSIGDYTYIKELIFWIVLHDENPVGIIGLYSYLEYPDDAFMGWYGVLPNSRSMGFGNEIFDFFEDYSRSQGYKNIRLYTDDIDNLDAIKLYYKKGMISEEYTNQTDVIHSIGKILILSKSLTERPTEKWDNKYLGLTAQVERQNC
ncbi:MAG TPA: hypothetical protein DCP90_01770 [Clostridiales bacterium]|nr:MAG: hypothetical protein A2Y22_03420 [Clostridiales bacterium GWD2_32_59]HAN09322.1 hypothetical protein [Clostridiales bacterium]